MTDIATLSIAELEVLVRKHNRLYWDDNAPTIPDTEYDRLVKRLRELAPTSPVLTSMGPTTSPLGTEVKHRQPMLSLDKCYTDEDLVKWAQTFTGNVVVMPKFDGCACSLHYDAKGNLVRAATRGDGVSGEDITVNVRGIKDVPQHVPTSTPLEVRGEVYMRLSVFEKYKAEGHANPRNLAAGAIKQHDPVKSAAYNLSFAAYDIVGGGHTAQEEVLQDLAVMGFPPINHILVNQDRIRDGYVWLAAKRSSLDYEVDGVVFRADSVGEQVRLGSNSHHPRYSLAYKFQGDVGVSILRGVEWSVARTGIITPVAVVDPVTLSGASVARASLHNAGFIAKLGLTLGAEVEMCRRGGVIPNVERVVKPGATPVQLPTVCPSCGAPVTVQEDFLSCSKPATCKASVVGQLSHFATTLDMLGFGDVILEQAYDAGVLRSPEDFYTLTVDKLAPLGRVGVKTATKLVAEVDAKRTLDLVIFLRSLGVPELGRHVSKILVEWFKTLDAVLKITVANLAGIPTLGVATATAVVQGLKDAAPLVAALRAQVKVLDNVPVAPAAPTGGVLAGMSFVFTGKMTSLVRADGEALVRKHGGTVLDGVTKALTHLVVGNDKSGPPSNKEKAAEKLITAGKGPKVISETDFLAMVPRA